MEIKYRNIILRDYTEADVDDEIRWNTVETEWALWDAPWEMEEELADFDPEKYRQEQLAFLQKPRTGMRWCLEVDTEGGKHIGCVNAYLINGNYEWVARADGKDGEQVYVTVGIEINESSCWNHGYGTQALAAFIRYLMDNGHDEICTQTWSGNVRMIRCAEKLGFRECCRKKGIRQVRGEVYDGLTFRLDVDAFKARFGENL